MLSIVIPAFDEARRLPRTLDAIRAFAATQPQAVELIIVDDGSRDDTPGVVRRWAGLAAPREEIQLDRLHLRLLRNEVNRGKGFSVRRGMLASAGDPILMYDADGSAPLTELVRLLDALANGADIAIGSRDLPGARLDPPQPWRRRILAALFRTVRRRMLLPELRDTQCGFKLYHRPAAEAVLAHSLENGWFFDCETLALARRLGFRIAEVPIHWRDDRASRVRPLREALRAPAALWRIARRVRTLRTSDRG